MLAVVHELDGRGLSRSLAQPPAGDGPLARRARDAWHGLDQRGSVLTHHDFWSGNSLWQGGSLSGVVDWSGGREAPRGVDLAWCRLDLVLMGWPAAAHTLLRDYERRCGVDVRDIAAWDLHAAAQAEDVVETWAPNYAGVGRPELVGAVLRERLDDWARSLP